MSWPAAFLPKNSARHDRRQTVAQSMASYGSSFSKTATFVQWQSREPALLASAHFFDKDLGNYVTNQVEMLGRDMVTS